MKAKMLSALFVLLQFHLATQHQTPVFPHRVPKFNSEFTEAQRKDGLFSNFFSNIGSTLEKLFETEVKKQLVTRKVGKVYDSQDDEDDVGSSVVFPKCSPGSCLGGGEEIVCGEPARNGRIVNGTSTTAGAYPWTVGIQFVDKLYCGGSLITKDFVMTAAHCLKGISTSRVRLILGDHDRRRNSGNQVTRLIDRVFIHPNFVKKTFNNDIALIKMNRPVEYSAYIRPVCLPTENRSYNGKNTTVVGWGKMSEGGRPADVLQEVVVPVITQRKCRHETRYRKKEITNNMFCAGYDKGVLDACQGDSGGPMVWRGEDHDAYRQIGIVSWGQGCARSGYPGVYTKIGKYLDWIIRHINEEKSCFC